MTTAAAELLAAVLKLSPEDREELAEEVWDTLDPPPDRDIDRMTTDEQIAAELDRRAAELRADPSAGVPWEEVRRRIAGR